MIFTPVKINRKYCLWVMLLLILIVSNGVVVVKLCTMPENNHRIDATSFHKTTHENNDVVEEISTWVNGLDTSITPREKLLLNTLLLERVTRVVIDLSNNTECIQTDKCRIDKNYVAEANRYYALLDQAAQKIRKFNTRGARTIGNIVTQ